jgi:hypothetical protein
MADDDQLADVVRRTHQHLREAGTTIEAGLDDGELARVGAAIGVEIPPDLAAMWRLGLPVGDSWPAWRADPDGTADAAREFIRLGFAFDIEHGGYWLDAFGPRPEDLDEAKAVAASVIAEWPPLIRVFGHRYLVTDPPGPGSPVLSVWQAVDSIYYGRDLADYLEREFLGADRPVIGPAGVPCWGDAFDL